ncbi:MAG: menaquinone reductase integral membrane subunit QrcD [Desulfatibacillaceae bacterium]
MDKALQPPNRERAPFWQFVLWLGPWILLALWGGYAAALCWIKALNQTNMNDYYGFALWIWADLAVIALGGGAFFSGFLRYVVGKDKIQYIINYAVLIGFICYSSALLILGLDVGQPLRGWFIFWHANVHSMLTEVAFCLSAYFLVLTIEYVPLVLENKQLDRVPLFHNLSHNFHEVMAIFAATGAFLSFFHQGSLGGVAGVLYGRPFAFRDHIFIWPYTFFLFTWSAAAYGPTFTILLTRLAEFITGKRLVRNDVYHLLAKISGWMILTYMIAKIWDTVYWAINTAPEMGFTFMDFYTNNGFYGLWIVVLELVLGGIVPALLLVFRRTRENRFWMLVAVILACIGVSVNRWVMVLQVMAVPVMPFDQWVLYYPSWQEVATTLLPVAYGAILISLSYRYLPVFPQEPELNPVDHK